MDKIGINVEKLDKIIRESKKPTMGREWQLNSEHIVNSAEFSMRKSDWEKLTELDLMAHEMVKAWESKNK